MDVKGILIDPTAKSITETTIKDYDYTKVYPLIEAGTFDIIAFDDTNALFIDDEGLFKETKSFFVVQGYAQPVAGKAVLLGNNEDGDTVSTTWNLDAIKAPVSFPDGIR